MIYCRAAMIEREVCGSLVLMDPVWRPVMEDMTTAESLMSDVVMLL